MHITNLIKLMHRHYPPPTRLESTITTIVVHHDAAPIPKAGKEVARLQQYSLDHAEKGWGGIGYHYAIAADGKVYKCNAVTSRTNHAKGGNKCSIGVMLMGNFDITKPTVSQVASLKELIAQLRSTIPAITQVLPHRKVKGSSTACPGKNLPNSVITSL